MSFIIGVGIGCVARDLIDRFVYKVSDPTPVMMTFGKVALCTCVWIGYRQGKWRSDRTQMMTGLIIGGMTLPIIDGILKSKDKDQQYRRKQQRKATATIE